MVKNRPKIAKSGMFYAFRSVVMETCNLNVTVVLEFISRDLHLLFAMFFSLKFQKSKTEIRP